jgi:uncharacterized protein YjbI with pentapeptide repeats
MPFNILPFLQNLDLQNLDLQNPDLQNLDLQNPDLQGRGSTETEIMNESQ